MFKTRHSQTGIIVLAILSAALLLPSFAAAEFTCKGDGIQDDTACLQSAMYEAVKTGTLVLSKNKTFLITSQLSVPGNLFVNGNGSRIVMKYRRPMVLIQGSNITLRNTIFEYQGPESVTIINFAADVANVTIRGCKIVGRNALAAIYMNNPRIHSVYIQDNSIQDVKYGILTDTTKWPRQDLPILRNHPYDIVIKDNRILNVGGDGIEINSAVRTYVPYNSGIPGVAAHDIKITGNRITAPNSSHIGAGFCIGLAGAFNVLISGNQISDCKWQFIHIEDTAHNITIIDNEMWTLIGNKPTDAEGWYSGRAGILVMDSTKVNILRNSIFGTIDAGIDILYDGKRYNSEVAVSENSIHNTGAACVSVGGPAGVDIKTWIGPVPNFAGNTVGNCKGGAFQVAPGTKGVVVTGNRVE